MLLAGATRVTLEMCWLQKEVWGLHEPSRAGEIFLEEGTSEIGTQKYRQEEELMGSQNKELGHLGFKTHLCKEFAGSSISGLEPRHHPVSLFNR